MNCNKYKIYEVPPLESPFFLNLAIFHTCYHLVFYEDKPISLFQCIFDYPNTLFYPGTFCIQMICY